MTFTPEQVSLLEAHLDRSAVKQRTQSKRTLDYIEAWWAIKEANRIFGFDNWTRETVDMRCVSEKEAQLSSGAGWSVSYVAKVRVTVEGVLREGTGAGHGKDRDLGQAHESAVKEAESDAMKRALMTFGNPFGLALYDKTQAEVANVEQEAPQNSAYSLKKNGQWEDFIERLAMKEDPDEARAWWTDKMKPWATKNGWPSAWVTEGETEVIKHCNSMLDKQASI